MRNKSTRLVAPIRVVAPEKGASAPRHLVEPWALRAIGRRGALMRHAILQARALAAGGKVDTSRLPSSAQWAPALPRGIERHLDELGRPTIIVEN
jgi:hypothetical protein